MTAHAASVAVRPISIIRLLLPRTAAVRTVDVMRMSYHQKKTRFCTAFQAADVQNIICILSRAKSVDMHETHAQFPDKSTA